MDNKLASVILVALLVGASLAVFVLSSDDEETNGDTKSQNDQTVQEETQTPPENVAPTILVENRTFEWTGANHLLQGYIVDENPSSVVVEITMLNQDFSIYLTDISTQSDANGYWQVEFSESEPGQWLVQIKATDVEAAMTERLIEYIVTVPNE